MTIVDRIRNWFRRPEPKITPGDEIAEFAGWLTTQPTIKVGASEPVYPLFERVEEFRKLPRK